MSATVLVVEDEPDIVRLVEVIMRRGGYSMIEAGTIQEASRAIAQGDLDLVLLDLGLPDGEGWEILNDTRAKEIPVVLLSAHSSPSTARRAQFEGVAGYVTKPFTPEQLLSAVGSVIGPKNE